MFLSICFWLNTFKYPEVHSNMYRGTEIFCTGTSNHGTAQLRQNPVSPGIAWQNKSGRPTKSGRIIFVSRPRHFRCPACQLPTTTVRGWTRMHAAERPRSPLAEPPPVTAMTPGARAQQTCVIRPRAWSCGGWLARQHLDQGNFSHLKTLLVLLRSSQS